MDYTTVILGTLALAALVGLAWMGGYELGQSAGEARGTDRERDLANRRINPLLAKINKLEAGATPKRRTRK